MEIKIGDYFWSSYHEHVGIRNEVFLNKSPITIEKSEWLAYLLEGIEDDSFSKMINLHTIQGKPIGKISVKNG